ncbi:MFS family permease [Prauserella sediminis]|uniref:MFS family permease n=1 Tax=Prauserella sediminis TaxID=577680 RepID=A0A839XRY4_9PSEU|nr:MFS transporter [Prauserella sediminis]MBB3665497.1 MFS family permease [Prauserella sediminis]
MVSSDFPVAAPPTTRPVWLIIAVLIVADIVSSIESSMMLVALPRLIEAFDANAADVSWVITAFLLVAAVSAAICGRLGDIYGRRRLLIILLLVSVIGSIVSIAGGTLASVVIGRAIQGVSGGILPLCFGLAREHLPAKRVPTAIALVAATAMLAAAIGGLMSGIIIDNLDWHYLFVAAGVIAIVAAAACLALPKSTIVARVERIDYPGAVLFTAAIALILLGVTKSATWTWADGRTAGCIVGGILVLAAWIRWELRTDSPMINIRMFARRTLAMSMAAMMSVASGLLGGATVVLPMIYINPTGAPVGLGLSATTAGAIGAATTVIAFAAAPISGRISARVGSRWALVVGTGLGIAAAVGMAALNATVVGFVLAAMVALLATSFVSTSLPNLVVEEVPAENTSEMTGVITVVRLTFTGVGTAIVTLLLSLSVVPGTQFATTTAFNSVFAFIGACCVAGLVIALLIRPRSHRTSAVPAPTPAVGTEA